MRDHTILAENVIEYSFNIPPPNITILSSQLQPILESKVDAIARHNDLALLAANEREHDLLVNFIESTNLSTSTLSLTPQESQNANDGNEVIVLKYDEEQGKYEQFGVYNTQHLDGRDIVGLRVKVVKLFNTTLRELQQRGFDSAKIDSMFERGMFPDNIIDVLRIKKVDEHA
jgi:hypothetical protein